MKRGFFNSKKPSKLQAIKPENAQKAKIKIPTGSHFPFASRPSANTTLDSLPTVQLSPSGSSADVTSGWAVNVVTLPRALCTDPTPCAFCIFFQGTKEAIISTPGFPASFFQDSLSLSYEIRASKVAGLGVFATKDIAPGDLIIVERPLFVMPSVFPASSVKDNERFVQQAVDGYMYANPRKALLALHNCKGPGMSRLIGIINTNAVGIDKLPGPYEGRHVAVCEKISRVNHSCSPNAFCRFDFLSFTFSLHALTAIPAGTEITISYFGKSLLPYASRRSELRDKYAFGCTCRTCSLPKAQRAQSDTRREVLRRHAESVDLGVDERELRSRVLESTDPVESLVKKSLAMMGIMEEEGLNEPEIWLVHTQRLVKAYAAFGDAANAQMWARRAAELTRAFTGKDGGWAGVVKDIKQTDWWGLRVGGAT